MNSSKNLALALLADGKSQAEVAAIAGVNQATISRLINGKSSDLSYREGKRLEEALQNSQPPITVLVTPAGAAR
ncbi:helix-turn-helix domain-containing protein [Undibacterium sp. Ji50W]|uniref:helix-turn-helix domain-containing protein n=1 Tax=Undibacterium sp. Ji50W TaxID=3413041 RepID=UPI003BEFB285